LSRAAFEIEISLILVSSDREVSPEISVGRTVLISIVSDGWLHLLLLHRVEAHGGLNEVSVFFLIRAFILHHPVLVPLLAPFPDKFNDQNNQIYKYVGEMDIEKDEGSSLESQERSSYFTLSSFQDRLVLHKDGRHYNDQGDEEWVEKVNYASVSTLHVPSDSNIFLDVRFINPIYTSKRK